MMFSCYLESAYESSPGGGIEGWGGLKSVWLVSVWDKAADDCLLINTTLRYQLFRSINGWIVFDILLQRRARGLRGVGGGLILAVRGGTGVPGILQR